MALAVFSGISVVGCGDAGPKIQKAKEAISVAAKATFEAASEQRDAFVKQSESQLVALDKKYDERKTKAATETAEGKKALDQKLEELKVKQEAAAAKLTEVKAASGSAWESLKDGFKNAHDELLKAFD